MIIYWTWWLKKDEQKEADYCIGFALIFVMICAVAWLAWWLADVIMFGINAYKDSNGVPLAHW